MPAEQKARLAPSGGEQAPRRIEVQPDAGARHHEVERVLTCGEEGVVGQDEQRAAAFDERRQGEARIFRQFAHNVDGHDDLHGGEILLVEGTPRHLIPCALKVHREPVERWT